MRSFCPGITVSIPQMKHLARSQEATRHPKTSKNNPRNGKSCHIAAQHCLSVEDGGDVAVSADDLLLGMLILTTCRTRGGCGI